MDTAEKLSITLPSEMVRAIQDRVAAGAYASASDAIREAVGLWQRKENEREERLAALRSRVQKSLSDTRPDVSLAEAFDRIAKHHANRAKSR